MKSAGVYPLLRFHRLAAVSLLSNNILDGVWNNILNTIIQYVDHKLSWKWKRNSLLYSNVKCTQPQTISFLKYNFLFMCSIEFECVFCPRLDVSKRAIDQSNLAFGIAMLLYKRMAGGDFNYPRGNIVVAWCMRLWLR